jgi:HK97 family phage prohead protease
MTVVTREFKIRSVNEEERTVEGIAIPYDTAIDIPSEGIKESVRRGAFGSPETVPFYLEHSWFRSGDPRNIGEVFLFDDQESGLGVKARFNNSSKANEAYAKALSGELNSFSVAFNPIEDVNEDGVVVRTKADLLEVSIVQKPAYTGAKVTQVRDNQNTKEVDENMSTEVIETTSEDVTELRAEVTTLKREIATLAQGGNKNEAGSQFRTAGEVLKGLLKGDEAAKAELRDFATTVDANVQPAWASDVVNIVADQREILNLFSKRPHPLSTSVTLPVLGTTTGTGTAGKQTAEGAALAYVEVQWTDVAFQNGTYGNYASLSRQVIDFQPAGYLDSVLKFQASEYARDTENALTSALYGLTGTATATLSADTYTGWATFIIDAVKTMKTNKSGLKAQFMIVSTDVFTRLATFDDGNGRPLMVVNGDGSNTIGSVNVTGLNGNVFGLPVVVDTGAANNTCYITNSEAVVVMESAGAPVRQEDVNIINLTQDFSLYGHLIVAPVNKLAIVKGDVDLV